MSEAQDKGRTRFIPTLTEVIDDAGDGQTSRTVPASNIPPATASGSIRVAPAAASNQFAREMAYAPASKPVATPTPVEEEYPSVMDMNFDPSMLDDWEEEGYGVDPIATDDELALEEDLSIISRSKNPIKEEVQQPEARLQQRTQTQTAPDSQARAPIQVAPPVQATIPMQEDDGSIDVTMDDYSLDESVLDLSSEDEELAVEIDDVDGLDVEIGGDEGLDVEDVDMGEFDAASEEIDNNEEIEMAATVEMMAPVEVSTPNKVAVPDEIDAMDEEIQIDDSMGAMPDEEEIFSPLSRNPAASEDSIRPSDLMLLALTERISARVRSGVKKNLETHIQTKIFPLLDGFAENLVKHLEVDIIKMIREEMADATREELDRLRRK